MNQGRRLVRTLGLAALFLLASIAPQAALAQLGLGSLVVTMTAPSNGANVGGTIPVSASVTAVGGLTVQSVQFKLDGANLGAADASAPYAINWDTRTASNGSHTLSAVATDVLGAQWTSNAVSVTVFNDLTPPSVSVTSPAAGATLSATVTLTANASDNVGVVGVQFQIDGVNTGAEATAAPYSASWNTLSATNASHTVTAIARDAAGNRTTSAAVAVTVFNDTTPPSVSVTSPAAGATVSATATVTANASDNVGVVGVQFKLDGVNLGAEVTAAPFAVSWDTKTASNASHVLTAVARDAAGNSATSAAVTVTVFNDTTPPSVSVTSPAAGTTVSGSITLAANATDNVGVVGVQFQVDGVNAGAEATAAPYSAQWNTLSATNGSHTVTAIARDAAGNRSTSAAVTVTVFNDTTPPSVSVTSPAAGATVSATVTLAANATDNVGVVGVQFQVDGVNAGAEASAAPYSASWNTLSATNGSHTITAIARDAAGNRTTSAAVTVTVFNDTTPPSVSVTSPAAGATVSATVTLAASATDNVGVVGVQFQVDGVNAGAEATAAPYSASWNTLTATNGSHTVTAIARDAAGNRTTSAAVTVTVFNDTTPPSVSVSAPAAGATVSGNVNVTANASDNVGVVGVQFKVDGANLGAEVTAAPYSAQWNTLTAANGSHSVTAVARDAAGNSTTSAAVTVTVFNDTAAPSVSITSPANGATVSRNVSVTANASDNVGVVGVQFKLDGASLGAEVTAAPYAVSWDTTTASNASHVLTAVARDAAGNSSTAAAVTVTVFNDLTPPSVSITSPSAGATVSGSVMVTASATDNVGVAGVQFKLDGANLGAEVTAAPFQVSWDTTTVSNASHTLSAVARDAAGNTSAAAAVSVSVNNLSPVALENQQPGTDNWGMWFGGMPADDVNKQIKGYASATSVNKGDSITFYVSATAQTFTIDIYRMGYYQGHGGRLLQSIGPLPAVQQPPCPADINTGLIECNWSASYTLAVPTSWTSGIFLAKLTSAAGFQNWITFVVRDDARPAPLVYDQPANTYQAYNNYPNDNATGKSLYSFNSFGAPTVSGQNRAVKVSFNRPYADRGAGQFFNWEYYFVRWLERSGYDVKYRTSVDLHEHGALGAKGLLSIAHDEYYSKEMYDGLEAARAAGVNMAFFGANGVYWQVRFEASPLTGVADRVMVGYKDRTTDPVQGPTTTILWRDPFINRPEQTLMGVQFVGQIDFSTPNVPFVVQNSSHWVYTGTGVHDGDQIPGIVGYEMDGQTAGTPAPDAIGGTYTVLGASPYTDPGSGASLVSNATIYQAPSGAWVFGAGTTSWGWGLDLDGTADARIQRMTSNILDRFVGKTN